MINYFLQFATELVDKIKLTSLSQKNIELFKKLIATVLYYESRCGAANCSINNEKKLIGNNVITVQFGFI